MCWLTSSDAEIDSLMALPRSRRSCLILSSIGSRCTLLRLRPVQAVGHGAPQLRPVCEIFPAAPLRITAKHRRIGDLPPAVIRLAHEAPKLRIDGNEVVAPVHRKKMRGAIRTDTG